ncbi:MAG: hypothetical protein COA38_14180 [Fluviicola sp.]|nr:MAG: hypothetical protein COA38_14180 [Fluviicola sp.]
MHATKIQPQTRFLSFSFRYLLTDLSRASSISIFYPILTGNHPQKVENTTIFANLSDKTILEQFMKKGNQLRLIQ